MSRAWYETNGLTYSDLDPRFEDDDAYQRWADSLGGSIAIDEDLVDLEDSASVLALQLRLRSWAELCDRRYFAEYPKLTWRQRNAYPGESWELACFDEDEPHGAAMPTVRVGRPTTRTRHYEFLHPERFTILKAKPKRVSNHATGGVVFDEVDFGDLLQVPPLHLELRAFAERDDDRWFQSNPGEELRERFICPGELRLARTSLWEYVEVRRIEGMLHRILMQDGGLPRRSPRWHGGDEVTDERYAPSRLYPCHGLR